MLEEIRLKIAGKKTYLVAISSILGALIAWVSGTMGTPEFVDVFITALLSMTVRAGIAKK